MNENENKYLSLKTAAGLYGYTRDHLGLMIRQGKLKGIKLGSYYVTTNEWVSDYLRKYADPDHPAIKDKFSNKFLTQVLDAKENKESEKDKESKGNIISRVNIKKSKIKTSRINTSNKSEDNFFSEIQKELLPSLQELSVAQVKKDILPVASTQQYIIATDPYIILPIRKMENSERDNILRKTYDRDYSESSQKMI